MGKKRPLEERFWSKVSKYKEQDACWTWLGWKTMGGYGTIRIGKRSENKWLRVNRVAWLLTHGSIPVGMDVLHRCDNRLCVRPEHLFLGTQADNNYDMVSKGRQRGAIGENHPQAKLTWEKVREIRKKHIPRTRGLLDNLASEYGVTRDTIKAVAYRKAWKE